MGDASQNAQIVDHFLDPARVLWRNLCLLELQTSAILSSAMPRASLELGPDMFLRGSNFKAQNVVLFFLFHRLDPAKATKSFAGVWPILDQRQDQEFRATVYKALLEFEKNGDIPRGTVQRSYLNCGFGTRLINLAWRFSEYVLHKVFEKEFPDFYSSSALVLPEASKMPISLLTAHVGALEGRFLLENNRLLESVQKASSRIAVLHRKIGSLAECYRDAAKTLELWQGKDRLFRESVTCPDAFSELANVERSKKLERFGVVWEQLNQLHSRCESFYNAVNSVLADPLSSNDVIKRYDNPNHNGEPNHKDSDLQEVLDDFATFLPRFSSSELLDSDAVLSAVNLQKENTVISQVGSQYSELQHLREILPKLSSEINDVRSSIADLNQELRNRADMRHQAIDKVSRSSSPEVTRIGLVPPTPLMSKPLLPPFTQTPLRSMAKLRPGALGESAVKKITFSARKQDRPHVKCPLPMASPAPNRNRS